MRRQSMIAFIVMMTMIIAAVAMIPSVDALGESVEVTSPSGGETYYVGETIHITWSYTAISGDADIYLIWDFESSFSIGTVPVGACSYDWTVPSGFGERSDYRIEVDVWDGMYYWDASEFFSLALGPYIHINGEAELATKSDSGTGTAMDPYVIENHTIDMSSYANKHAISIHDTTSHVIVRNCTVSGITRGTTSDYAGVYLSSAGNVTVTGNTLSMNDFGVIIDTGCNNVTVSDNDCMYEDESAIEIYESTNVIIDSNDCQNSSEFAAIYAYSSTNVTIYNNTCDGALYRGVFIHNSDLAVVSDNGCSWGQWGTHVAAIVVQDSPETFVKNNTMENVYGDGIIITSGSDSCVIENNTISSIGSSGTGSGIDLSGSCNLVQYNTISDVEQYSILVETSSWNNITHNTFLSIDDHGIYIRGLSGSTSENNNVSYNTIRDSACNDWYSHGIEIDSYSPGNIIYGNTISNISDGPGLSWIQLILVTGDRTVISHNNIDLCEGYGVMLDSSEYSIIDNNTISNCFDSTTIGRGIWVNMGSLHATVENNSITNCEGSGIYATGDEFTTGTFRYNTLSFNGADPGLEITSPADGSRTDDDYVIATTSFSGTALDGTVSTLRSWSTDGTAWTSWTGGTGHLFDELAVGANHLYGRCIDSGDNVYVETITVYRNYDGTSALRIDCDQDIIDLGLDGSGTEEDPYVIDDVAIDGIDLYASDSYEGPGIYVGNTTLHLDIRNSTLTNFNYNGGSLTHFARAILLMGVSNVTIDNCTLTGTFALVMDDVDNVTVNDTVFDGNQFAIDVQDSKNVTVSGSSFASVRHRPIQIASSEYCSVENSDFSGTTEDACITFVGCTPWTVSGSTFTECIYGVDASNSDHGNVVNCTFFDGGGAITTDSVSYTTISSCEIDRFYGIWLGSGSYNEVSDCVITNSSNRGIYTASSLTCSVFHSNTIAYCDDYGIVDDGWDNLYYGNVFVNNNGATSVYSSSHVQAFDGDQASTWDDGSHGNLWSDWTGPDNDHDGIVDSPYVLSGGLDDYPLTHVVTDAPTIDTITPSDGSYVEYGDSCMNWTATPPENETIVLCEVSVDSGAWVNLDLAMGYDLSSLSIGDHTIFVRIWSTGGNCTNSSVSYHVASAPGEPTSLAADVSAGSITITWAAPSFDGGRTITSYNVYRNGTLMATVTELASLTFTDDTVEQFGEYNYSVAAVNGMGEGDDANVTAVAYGLSIDVPDVSTEWPIGGSGTIEWTSNADGETVDIQLHNTSTYAVSVTYDVGDVVYGVAVDDEYVYIPDYNGDRVIVVSRDTGSFVRYVGTSGSGPGLMLNANDVAVDANYLYVVDSSSRKALVFSLDDWSWVTDISSNYAKGVASDDEYLFVSDSGGDKIYMYHVGNWTLAGTYEGSGDQALDTPNGLEADGGYLLVADYNHNRIVEISYPSLTYIRSIGSSTYLNSPTDVDLNDRYIYVADSNNNCIVMFEHDGTYHCSIGQSGSAVSDLRLPYGVAVDDETLYVADMFNDRVVEYATCPVVSTIATAAPDTGSYEWSIPFSLEEGDIYFMTMNYTGTDVMAESEPCFSLLAPPTAPVLSDPSWVDTGTHLQWTASDPGEGTVLKYMVFRNDTLIWTGPDATTREYNDTTVVAGHWYVYNVVCLGSVGFSDNSTAKDAYTIPATPSLSVDAWGSGSASYVNLTWGPVADGGSAVTSYSLYLNGTLEATYDVGDLPTCEGKYYLNLSVTPGYEYAYVVNATNGVGTSSASNEVTGTTVPQAPGALTASERPGYVNLTWTAPLDGGSTITGYYVYRNGTLLGTTSNEWYNDTTVVAGVWYEYNVTAENAIGVSSSSANATGHTVPAAPTGLTITWTSTPRLILSFDAPADGGSVITDYYIYRNGTYLGRSWSTSWSDLTIVPGESYEYNVTAKNGIGVSVASANATGCTPPAAPSGVQVVSGIGWNNVSWMAPKDGGSAITHYYIGYEYAITKPVSELYNSEGRWYFNVTNVPAGTEWDYYIQARNAIEWSESSVTVTGQSIPTAPSPTYASGPGWVNLTWSAPADGGSSIVNYTIHRNDTVSFNVTDNWFNDTTVVDGYAYTYNVTAVNGIGVGPTSSDVEAFTVPSVPRSVSSTEGVGYVNVTWNAPELDGGTAVTGYHVYRNGTPIGTTEDLLWYNDTTVVAGEEYTYTVTAVNVVGEGAHSAGTDGHTVPAAPTITPICVDGYVNVTWSEPADGGLAVTGYDVYRDGSLVSTGIDRWYNDTTVVAGQSYTYHVRATNSLGIGPNASADGDTVPAVPGSFLATSGSGHVNLTWTAPLDGGSTITRYNVYRNCTLLGTTSNEWYNDTTVVSGEWYEYNVTAVNVVGESAHTANQTGYTAPNVPGSFSASNGPGYVNLTWTEPVSIGSEIDHYNVYRNGTSIGTTEGLWYNDTTVVAGYEYTYSVTAENEVGESAHTSEATGNTVPAAPGSFTATSRPGYVNLTWSEPADGGSEIDHYVVYRAGGVSFVTDDTWYNDTSVIAGSLYCYNVTAINGVGESANSANEYGQTVPNVPGSFISTCDRGYVNLTWNAPSNGGSIIDHYNVYRNGTLLNTASSTYYNDTTVVAGVWYEYNVTAVNGVGEGAHTSNVTGYTVPATPVSFDSVSKPGYVNLTWTAPSMGGSPFDHYNVYRNGTLLDTTSDEWYNDTSVVAGVWYEYNVTAVNGVGEGAHTSNVTGCTVPAVPGSFTVTSGLGYVNITWAAPLNGGSTITHYVIHRNESIYPTTLNTWYNDTSVVDGYEYTYNVSVFNGVGESECTSDGVGSTVPAVPGSFIATCDRGYVNLTWNAPLDGGSTITGYNVYRNGTLLDTSESLWYNDTSVVAGVWYEYNVTAVNDVGESAHTSNVTGYTVPATPVSFDSVSRPGYVNLTWSAPSDGGSEIDHYVVYRSGAESVTTENTWYNDTTVVDGCEYTYNVTAVNDVGESAHTSNEIGHTVPGVPGSFQAASGPGHVNLTWSPAATGGSTITHYVIYRNGTSSVTTEGRWYNDTTVVDGYAYTYSVSAVNAVGEGSNTTEATGVTVPGVPKALSAASAPGYVNLTWMVPLDGGSEITGYNIYRNGMQLDTTSNEWYNDTTVIAGNDYNYTVTAVNDVGESAYTANATGNTIPSAPTLSGVANVRSNSLEWEFDQSGTWSVEGRLINVTVLRDDVAIATLAPAATSYVDDDIEIGVTYVYSVYANDTIGDSAPTNVTIVSLDVPSEPTGLVAVPGLESLMLYNDTIVALTWTAPSDGGSAITHYVIYRDSGDGLVEIATVTTTSFVDGDVENGTEYGYAVSAVNAVGEGPSSDAVSVTTYDVPTMPLNATLTPIVDDEGDTTIEFTWSAPADDGGLAVISYYVYRDGSYMATVDGLSYNDTTVVSGQSYCYQLVALNALGFGDPAGPLNVSTAPAAPCDLAAEAVDASVTLTWTAPADGGANITAYNVYRNGTFLVSVIGTSHVDDTVEAYTWYSYSVRAVNTVGEGPASTDMVFVPDTTAPTVNVTSPSDGAVIASNDVTVTWTANDTASGLASFNVTADDIWYELNATTFSLALTLDEGPHVVIVTAYDAAGNHANSTVEFTVAIEPTVIDHSPTGDDVPKDSSIVIEFSEPMDHDSVTVTCGSVTLTPSWNGNVITLTHDAFDADTTYAVLVNGDDTHGNAMDEFTWSFTTENVVTVTGTVSDADGPVAGATVTLDSGETTTTDSEGRYTLTTTPGEHTMTVTKDGFDTTTSTVTLTNAPVQTVDEDIVPSASSSGTMIMWVGLLLVVVAACAVGFVYYRRR